MLGFFGALCANGISWLLGLDPDARREGRDGRDGHETGGMVKNFPPGIPENLGKCESSFFFSILDDIGSCPSQWLKLAFFGEDWVNSPFFERKVRVRLSSADLKEPSLLYPESTFRNWVPVTEWVTSMFSC